MEVILDICSVAVVGITDGVEVMLIITIMKWGLKFSKKLDPFENIMKQDLKFSKKIELSKNNFKVHEFRGIFIFVWTCLSVCHHAGAISRLTNMESGENAS